jgi:hypothetical protein
MAYHDTNADAIDERSAEGWIQFRAHCRTCHWFSPVLSSRRAAEDAADDHVLDLVGWDDSVTDEGVRVR